MPTAKQKLKGSRLDPKVLKQELMGKDVDLESLLVYLKSRVRFDTIDRVTDVKVTRTIEGASTVDVVLNDYDRSILRFGLLTQRLDIELDGLWFRLAQVGKRDDELTLTFEDREIAILRTYTKMIWALRSKVTRAQFILRMIREVKEFRPPIPVVIPELNRIQPIEKASDLVDPFASDTAGNPVPSAAPGINPDVNTPRQARDPGQSAEGTALTVKGDVATPTQIQNANTILTVGVSKGARRGLLVTSIMVAIAESTLHNYTGGDGTSVGLFQQTDGWGSYSDRHDPATSAGLFFNAAFKVDATYPNMEYHVIAQEVQRSRPGQASNREDEGLVNYEPWHAEAEAFVTAFGFPPTGSSFDQPTGYGGHLKSSSATGGSAASANNSYDGTITDTDFLFYRGNLVGNKLVRPGQKDRKDLRPEDSWTAITRLARDVNWRAYFVSGIFYLITDDVLIKTQPVAIIQEFSQGVEGLDFDYDQGKKVATVELTARVGAWLAPPGSVIVLQGMGPVNGRWIVNTFERSLFDSRAKITLKKPLPRLPEPTSNGLTPPAVNPTYATPAPGDPTAPALSTATVQWPFGSKSEDQYRRVDQGWDLQDVAGAPVYAIAAGTVSIANANPGGFGNDYPILTLDSDIGGPVKTVYYGHVHAVFGVQGKHVNAGDLIAYANRTEGENGSQAPPGWLEIGFGGSVPYAHATGDSPSAAGAMMKKILLRAQPRDSFDPTPQPPSIV